MRFCLGILAAIVLSCGTARPDTKPQTSKVDISYCRLASDPSTFSGKRIRIRAIYRYAFEIQRLESPTCCPQRGPKIWVEISAGLEGRSEKLFRKLDKQGAGVALVVFVGRFEGGGPYGSFGDRFQLSVDEIEKVERVSRSSLRQGDPAWVPQNCEHAGP